MVVLMTKVTNMSRVVDPDVPPVVLRSSSAGRREEDGSGQSHNDDDNGLGKSDLRHSHSTLAEFVASLCVT